VSGLAAHVVKTAAAVVQVEVENVTVANQDPPKLMVSARNVIFQTATLAMIR